MIKGTIAIFNRNTRYCIPAFGATAIRFVALASLIAGLLAANTSLGQNAPVVNQQVNLADNITITFTASGKTLTQGPPLSILNQDGLNLKYANYNPADTNATFYLRTNCNQLIVAYRDSRVKSYDIEITGSNFDKKYFGKIAFFTSKQVAKDEPYTIAIPQQFYVQASNGRTAMVYQSYPSGQDNYVQWIIWLSDKPIPNIQPAEILEYNTPQNPIFAVHSKINNPAFKLGVAATVVSYLVFIPAGATLAGIGGGGVNYYNNSYNFYSNYNGYTWTEYYSKDFKRQKILLGVGCGVLAVGIVGCVLGPMTVAHIRQQRPRKAPASQRLDMMDLCFSPNYNPVTQSVSLGLNMHF